MDDDDDECSICGLPSPGCWDHEECFDGGSVDRPPDDDVRPVT